jgi:hypothetical protein
VCGDTVWASRDKCRKCGSTFAESARQVAEREEKKRAEELERKKHKERIEKEEVVAFQLCGWRQVRLLFISHRKCSGAFADIPLDVVRMIAKLSYQRALSAGLLLAQRCRAWSDLSVVTYDADPGGWKNYATREEGYVVKKCSDEQFTLAFWSRYDDGSAYQEHGSKSLDFSGLVDYFNSRSGSEEMINAVLTPLGHVIAPPYPPVRQPHCFHCGPVLTKEYYDQPTMCQKCLRVLCKSCFQLGSKHDYALVGQ